MSEVLTLEPEDDDWGRQLSRLQAAVVRLRVAGFAVRAIAAHLHISVRTVDSALARSSEKLGLARKDLVAAAWLNGFGHVEIIDPPRLDNRSIFTGATPQDPTGVAALQRLGLVIAGYSHAARPVWGRWLGHIEFGWAVDGMPDHLAVHIAGLFEQTHLVTNGLLVDVNRGSPPRSRWARVAVEATEVRADHPGPCTGYLGEVIAFHLDFAREPILVAVR